jgi:hypothetical protein
MKQALVYSLKVWLTSAVGSTIAWTIIYHLIDPHTESLMFVPMSLLFITMATIFVSIPSWLVFLIAIVIVRRISEGIRAKLMIFIVAEGIVLLTFFCFLHFYPGFEANNFWKLSGLHCLIIGLSVWIYNLESASLKLKDDITTP